MSTFSYEIFQIINKLEIGRKWEEYIESSSDLSSIFNKIDDSDGIVEQHEIQMLKIWAERLKNYTGSLNIKDLLNNNQLKIDDNFKLVYNEFEKLNPAEIITADNFLLENISMEGFNELRNKNKNQNADTQKLIESLAEYNFDDTYRYEVESNKLFTFIYDKNDILIARLNNNAQTLLIYDQDGFKEKQINLNNNTVTPLRSRTTSTPASADKRIDAFISASFGTSENLMISVIKLTGEDIYKLSQKD
ncbi:hypothetical protein IKB17_02075 [bacterium]|nr:hypothetical protein [bacterium]